MNKKWTFRKGMIGRCLYFNLTLDDDLVLILDIKNSTRETFSRNYNCFYDFTKHEWIKLKE